MVARILLPLFLLVSACGGCVELAALIYGVNPDGSGGPPVDDGDTPTPPDGPSDQMPVVRLSVSNPNPLVGEELMFLCTLEEGASEDLTFAFQPMSSRLVVNSQTGRATFVVDQSDVGIALVVTCTATNAFGASEPSNQQVIIAGSAPGGP